ncbi:hypothetical protein T09_865 [Trichinella sp. T9]|nr:hypothetical protein T09_865 [Trichinella sp. T9]
MQIKKSHTRDRPCVFVLVDHHPAAGSFGMGRRHHVDNDRAKHVDQQAGDVDGRAGHGQPKRISHFLLVNFGQRVQHSVLEFVGHVEEHDHRAAGEHHANARVHRPEDVRHSNTVGAAEHRQADQAEAGGGAEQRQRGDVEPVVVAGVGHRRRGMFVQFESASHARIGLVHGQIAIGPVNAVHPKTVLTVGVHFGDVDHLPSRSDRTGNYQTNANCSQYSTQSMQRQPEHN